MPVRVCVCTPLHPQKHIQSIAAATNTQSEHTEVPHLERTALCPARHPESSVSAVQVNSSRRLLRAIVHTARLHREHALIRFRRTPTQTKDITIKRHGINCRLHSAEDIWNTTRVCVWQVVTLQGGDVARDRPAGWWGRGRGPGGAGTEAEPRLLPPHCCVLTDVI